MAGRAGPGVVAGWTERSSRERSVRARMVPESLYQRVRTDQPLYEAVAALLAVQLHSMSYDDTDRGRRTLLAFDETGRFAGLVRAQDVVRYVASTWRASGDPPARGAFRRHARAAARLTVAHVVQPATAIDVSATVMEAAQLMAERRLSHLVVTQDGRLVGLLRPEDLYQDVVPAKRPRS